MAPVPSGRVPAYLDQYARTLGAAYRVEQIRREIASEQDQVRYIDSLIAQAQQNAAGLEAALQAQPPASLETATALLKERYDAESAARGRRAGEGLAARRATELTAEDRAAFTPTGRLSKAEVAQAAERAVSDPKTTPEKAAAIASYVEKQLGSDYKGLERIKGRLRAPAAAGGARAQAPGVRAMTPQEAAREETLNQLFETTYFAGPSGIVGGFDGKAVADARAQTKAPAGTGFATAEDAFVAALASLANGTIDREDFESDEAFNYAKDVYADAKVAKAYRNDQRTAFEPAVLSARQQVAELRRQREQAVGSTYEDPGQEAIRRELRARGYLIEEADSKDAWKNAYIKYQKTPDYGVYIAAHERVRDALAADQGLSASNRIEQIAAQYVGMKLRRGDALSVQDLRDQLKRVGYTGKPAEDAIAFAMAYTELGGDSQSPERRAQLKGLEVDAQKQTEARKQAVSEADAALARAQAAVAKQEEAVAARAPAPATTPPPAAPGARPAQGPTVDQLKEQRRVLEERARSGASRELEGEMLSGSKGEVLPSTDEQRALPAGARRLLDIIDQGAAGLSAPAAAPAPRAPAPAPRPAAPAPRAPAPAPRAPAPAPRAPAPRAPAAAQATAAAPPPSEAAQLKQLLLSGKIPRGTAQYNAALDRLDELEAQ